jgi:hypothetical protein
MGISVVFPVVAEVVTAEQGEPRRAVEAAGLVGFEGLVGFVGFVGPSMGRSMGNERAHHKQLEGTEESREDAVKPHIGEGTV